MPAELGLAAQRLLGHERVRSDRPGVDFVIHEVVQFHHIHVPHRDGASERFTGPSIVQSGLPARWQLRFLQQLLDLFLRRPVKHRTGDVQAKSFRSPSQMGLEDLPHVHARRDSQRIQDDLDRCAVWQVRHILLGENPGYHSFISMPTGHLIPDGHLPLHRDIDLDQLDDAGWELIAAFQPPDFLVVQRLQELALLLGPPLNLFELFLLVGIAQNDVPDVLVGEFLEDLGGQFALLFQNHVTAFRIHQIPSHDLP